jgi:hypothetical protein
LLASFHSWSVQFVRREGNDVAHYLAQLAVTKKLNQEWFDKCPRGLSESVRKDLCKIHFPQKKKSQHMEIRNKYQLILLL